MCLEVDQANVLPCGWHSHIIKPVARGVRPGGVVGCQLFYMIQIIVFATPSAGCHPPCITGEDKSGDERVQIAKLPSLA